MSCDKQCFIGNACNREDCEVRFVLSSSWFEENCKKYNYAITDFTCYKCAIVDKCLYSFDLYNTNGDCLNDK